MNNYKPKIIAHRIIDENINDEGRLKELLTKLRNKNIDGVEFDIRQTKDEEFIVFHDSKFPQWKKKIKECTFEELKEETVRNNFSFLTLQEVLKTIPNEFQIQIDLKDNKVNIEKFIKIISPFNIFERLIISSFYPRVILQISHTSIKRRWFLTSISLKRNPFHLYYATTPIITALSCQATGIVPRFNLISENLIKKAHNRNLTVAAWTIDKNEKIKRFSALKIDFIIVPYSLLI